MDDTAIKQLFSPLWNDVKEEDQFYNRKPLLAHYTSIQVLESILKNDELWFSNPLFMNDLKEVRFAILEGVDLIRNSDEIERALRTPERVNLFKQHFDYYFNKFADDDILDTYILCLAEHNNANNDGTLSMWRGYGNNASGAAIVFDSAKIEAVDGTPIAIAKVIYATEEEQIIWMKDTISKFIEIFNTTSIPDDKLYIAAFALFERIQIFALFTKDHGFKEENEWRIVYMKDRDSDKKLEPMYSYFIGPRGIEPKLKLKLTPVPDFMPPDLSLIKLIDRIILGPGTSSPLAKATIFRMLDIVGKSELKEKVRTSTIPFRSM
ncbi:DUF2971 domain-containing protein [Pelosinus sp. IPA-1]|uniref:DUF2971 domain-containing protein n=1 Tax=Pelosinus sp. IPA-1 TaxID=3029569 RepID=UPI002436277B|nr:DUF2971 domain-containing protein [Pelosinus sp. IPA-1]GMB00093.1 hypothetical protein PIPA1_28920 [Pelosinus sp. IPA-1]